MISKPALPLLALMLSACAATPRPIPVLAEAHRCPAFPQPPEGLLKPPAMTDFFRPTH